MSSPDDRRSTRTDLDAVAVLFAALLVGPLVAYWAVRLVGSALGSAARRLSD